MNKYIILNRKYCKNHKTNRSKINKKKIKNKKFLFNIVVFKNKKKFKIIDFKLKGFSYSIYE